VKLATLCSLPALVLSLATTASAAPTLYKIDPNHSSAQFRVKHLGISTVMGTFKTVSGTVLLDDKDLSTAKVEAVIDATSVDTDNEKRDEHLRSADFFDVEKFPEVTFTSTKWTKTADGFDVEGTLNMHGVAKPVVLKLESISPETKNPANALVRATSASTKINRRDFGLNWTKVVEGVSLVSDEVKITLDIEVIKAVDQAAASNASVKK
jgi:polyisoprenoid-binding protein YceI